MLKKICPYCDQVLTGNYCKGCKRFVRKPLLWDVDYYLNERHPASEENCQYHGDLHTGQMPRSSQAGKAGKGAKSGQKSQTVQRAGQNQAKRNYQAQPNRQQSSWQQTYTKNVGRSGGKKKSRKPMILFIISVYFLISLAVTLFGRARKFYGDIADAPAPDTNALESAWASYEAKNDWTDNLPEPETEYETFEGEVRAEDVIAAGVRCNGYGHFDVDGDSFMAQLKAVIRLNGYDEAEWMEYGYNEDRDGFTLYNTMCEYDFLVDGEYQGYVTVSVDTADRSLHGFEMIANEESVMYSAADIAIDILDEFGLMEYDGSGKELFDQMYELGEGDNYGEGVLGDMYVSAMKGDDGFRMMTFMKATADSE